MADMQGSWVWRTLNKGKHAFQKKTSGVQFLASPVKVKSFLQKSLQNTYLKGIKTWS